MQPDIHPRYEPVAFRDVLTGTVYLSRSTRVPAETTEVDGVRYPVISCDVTAASHPFWTGTARSLDSEGRIERFRRRYAHGPRS